MSNVHSGYSRHFKSRRPRLRFADDIIRKSSKPAAGTTPRDVQSSAEEGESVGSDDAAPAMSEVSNSFSSRTDFTAIFKVANQVRAMAGNLSIASLHSLAEILISCLESTLRSLKLLPSRIRSALNFGVAFRGVIFSGGMFSHHVGRVTTRLSGIQLTEAVQLSLQSLDMTMASLKTLLDLVECSDTQGKLPLDISGGSDVALVIPQTSVEYPPIPTIASADNVPVRKTLLEAQRKLNDPILRTRMIPTKSSLRQLVSGLGSKGTIRPLTLWSGTVSLRSSSTAPPVDGLPGGPYLATPTTPTTHGLSDSDGSYQQAHHNGVVVSTPPTTEQSPKRINLQVLNVELPLSPNELYFSHNGVLCAASLEALVRILTSSEAVRDPSFDVFFFFSFRFFSKPLEIFNLLVEQYDERPPEGLQPAQVNLWEQNAPVAKVRVAKVFLLWLRSSWRYQWDMDVLEPLRQFASDRPTNDPASITWDKVTRNVNDASVGVRQGFRMQRIAQIVSEHQSTRLSRPFELLTEEMMSQGDFDKVDVLYFHNPPGREEFARQLCLAASGLFRHIDPEDAVRYWRNGQNKTVGEKISCLASFENALSYWVSNAIVVRPTVRSRAEVMEFFIDLASQCVAMRNFASACAISTGINLCRTRLRETAEIISDNHRIMAAELEELFAICNRKSYRSTLRLALEQGPTVPLISMFKHDIDICWDMKAFREHPEHPGKMLIDIERYRVISRTIQGMELCHARYDFEHISYIHIWLQQVLLDYTGRPAEDNLRLLDNLSNNVEPKK